MAGRTGSWRSRASWSALGRPGAAGLAVLVAVAGAVTWGLLIAPSASPAPTAARGAPGIPSASQTARALPEAVFIGDSFTAGYGATRPESSFVDIVGAAENWHADNLGLGSTGYSRSVSTDGYDACGMEICPSYDGVIAQAVALSPDIIVVSGGVNDVGTDTVAEQDAIFAFYRDLRAALPQARIMATSPLPDGDAPNDELGEIETAAASAVASVGGSYLDIGQPLTGHPELLDEDGIHPNDAGHAAIAAAILAALGTAPHAGGSG